MEADEVNMEIKSSEMALMFTLKQSYFNEFQLTLKKKITFAGWSLWLTRDADVFCTNCSNLRVSLLCILSAPALIAPWYLNRRK